MKDGVQTWKKLTRVVFIRKLTVDAEFLRFHFHCDTPERADWRATSDRSLFQCFGCWQHCGSSRLVQFREDA
jgi:hypothetical protein